MHPRTRPARPHAQCRVLMNVTYTHQEYLFPSPILCVSALNVVHKKDISTGYM